MLKNLLTSYQISCFTLKCDWMCLQIFTSYNLFSCCSIGKKVYCEKKMFCFNKKTTLHTYVVSLASGRNLRWCFTLQPITTTVGSRHIEHAACLLARWGWWDNSLGTTPFVFGRCCGSIDVSLTGRRLWSFLFYDIWKTVFLLYVSAK